MRIEFRLKLLHLRFFVFQLVVICLVDVLFQAFGHFIDGMGNVGKCSLIKVSSDAVIQLVLAQRIQSIPDAARLTLNRSHDQTKHKDTQRRELQNRRQKLRRAGVRFQKQFFPVDRVVNRAATCGEWIDHSIPFSGICLEYAAAGLKYFLWKFDVFLARIVQKPPFVADDLKLQTFQRQVFFRKLLDLADSIAKQQNTLCESRSAARDRNRISEL